MKNILFKTVKGVFQTYEIFFSPTRNFFPINVVTGSINLAYDARFQQR